MKLIFHIFVKIGGPVMYYLNKYTTISINSTDLIEARNPSKIKPQERIYLSLCNLQAGQSGFVPLISTRLITSNTTGPAIPHPQPVYGREYIWMLQRPGKPPHPASHPGCPSGRLEYAPESAYSCHDHPEAVGC